MHNKALTILIVLSLLTFANCLHNEFIGDDHILFSQNAFYHSWHNVSNLLSTEYLTDTVDLIKYGQDIQTSGSVAYRPVLSLSYFLDYHFWKDHPPGYHATNIIFHLINGILVYFLIWRIMGDSGLALLSAVLFAVHPLKSEPVCNIGYRADLLFSFFSLCALHCYISAAAHNRLRDIFGLTFFYLLSLFTKEAALAIIPILLAYEYIIRKTGFRGTGGIIVKRLSGPLIITVIYVFLYLKVFTNTTFSHLHWLNGSPMAHVKTIFMIFASYTYHLFFPFTVSLLPPLYTPSLGGQAWFLPLAGAGLLALLIAVAYCFLRKNPAGAFFMIWYLLALIPVANIIPLENPMAHRFLYFPSIAAAVLLAVAIKRTGKFRTLIAVVFICPMIFLTVTLNRVWRSDENYGSYLVHNYPDDKNGYVILGNVYFQKGLYPQAAHVFKKSIELGVNDPRIYFLCGQSSVHNPQEAIFYLTSAIKMRPDYVHPYIALGRAYLFWGEVTLAQKYLRQSMEVFPTYTGYGYLLQILLREGSISAADTLFDKARESLNSEQAISSLKKIMHDIKEAERYIDIGI
jgi:protein O-mannosyl-transferase